MYPAVKEVIPCADYMLLLTFANGEQKKFDVKPYLNTGIFRELKNIDQFRNVRVCFDSIEWGNEADLDPHVLYSDSEKV